MPIYSWQCSKDNTEKEELRAMGDFTPPKCSVCGADMKRVLSPITIVLKGSGWSHGDWDKLKKRSEEQGVKFFKRHPEHQTLVKETLEQKTKEA